MLLTLFILRLIAFFDGINFRSLGLVANSDERPSFGDIIATFR
jgi:hypothetical protein